MNRLMELVDELLHRQEIYLDVFHDRCDKSYIDDLVRAEHDEGNIEFSEADAQMSMKHDLDYEERQVEETKSKIQAIADEWEQFKLESNKN